MLRSQLIIASLLQAFTFVASADSLFDQIDQNHDHIISTQESQLIPELAGKMNRLDRDGDNQLDSQEFALFKPMNQTVSWVWQPTATSLATNDTH